MLTAREETLHIHKPYDMVLICSGEGNYLVMDIYQLSKFISSNSKAVQRLNNPFYTAARSLDSKKETIVYLDEHQEKGLMIKNLQAFYHICNLMNTLDIHVLSAKEYRCVWK